MKTNQRKNKNKKVAALRRPNMSLSVHLTHPPPIQQYAIVHKQRLRFITNASFAGGITFQNLLDTILIATTALAPYDLFDYVKINLVEIWSRPSDGLVNTVSLTFVGAGLGVLGDSVTHTDTSMGIEPAHLVARPSPKSQVSQFQSSSSNNAMYLTLPASSVIDVILAFKGTALGLTTPALNASVGASVGGTYWRGLDGKSIATTSFLPPTGISAI